jgi:hypothetical protein
MLFTIGFQSILNLILHDANSSENFHKNVCNTSASFINELFQAAYYLYCSKWVRVNQQTICLRGHQDSEKNKPDSVGTKPLEKHPYDQYQIERDKLA